MDRGNGRGDTEVRIYLAHNSAARDGLLMVVAKSVLEGQGHEVTSTWISELMETACEGAQQNLADINRSDALILFTDQVGEEPGRGKFTEFGYALAKGKMCFVCGNENDSNVFYFLPQVTKLKTLDELAGWVNYKNTASL